MQPSSIEAKILVLQVWPDMSKSSPTGPHSFKKPTAAKRLNNAVSRNGALTEHAANYFLSGISQNIYTTDSNLKPGWKFLN